MKAKYLFPPVCRLIGWLLAIPGFVLGIPVVYADHKIPGFEMRVRDGGRLFMPEIENFTNELALTLVIVGLVLVAFSRIRREDELTGKLRLNALYWAILINLIMLAAATGLIGLANISKIAVVQKALSPLTDNLGLYVYNLFMPLLIFIARFYYLLYRNHNEYELKPLKFLPYKPFNLIGKTLSALTVVLIISGCITNLTTFTDLCYALPLALVLWAYTRERQEDEYISTVRLDAMQIAVYVNYAVMLISNFMFYGIDFLLILIVNLSTIPLIFVIVFHYRLWRLRRQHAGNTTAILI